MYDKTMTFSVSDEKEIEMKKTLTQSQKKQNILKPLALKQR